MRVPHQIVVLSLIGFAAVGVARSLPEAQPGHDFFSWNATRSSNADAPLDALGQTAPETAGQDPDESHLLIQEPSRRRAQRPQFGNPFQNVNQRSSFPMLRAFREAIGDSWKGTVDLIVDEERVAFGAVVDPDGWIISKDSQIPRSGKVLCRFADGNESLAEAVDRNVALDLVLLRVPDRNLSPITWADDMLPQRGRWVATTDTHSTPAAVGVVSAGIMSVAPKKAVLGVLLKDADSQGGALIEQVLRGTGADLAGLKVGDKIRAIDGQHLSNRQAAMSVLESCRPGQSIQLAIVRGESELETRAQMMDLANELHDETEMEVNGQVSARSSGFSTVFLHDTVLSPTQCGGPLVDLNGHVVGINIARAGRVTSYALPTSTVRPEVERMLAEAKGGSVVSAGANVVKRNSSVR